MSNVKHTPGPWTVEDPMEGELSIVQANKPPYEWRTIAAVPQGDPEDGFPQEIVEANARLIAAAPELLSALKECTAALEFFDTAVKGYRHADLVALIAKAECDPPEAR